MNENLQNFSQQPRNETFADRVAKVMSKCNSAEMNANSAITTTRIENTLKVLSEANCSKQFTKLFGKINDCIVPILNTVNDPDVHTELVDLFLSEISQAAKTYFEKDVRHWRSEAQRLSKLALDTEVQTQLDEVKADLNSVREQKDDLAAAHKILEEQFVQLDARYKEKCKDYETLKQAYKSAKENVVQLQAECNRASRRNSSGSESDFSAVRLESHSRVGASSSSTMNPQVWQLAPKLKSLNDVKCWLKKIDTWRSLHDVSEEKLMAGLSLLLSDDALEVVQGIEARRNNKPQWQEVRLKLKQRFCKKDETELQMKMFQRVMNPKETLAFYVDAKLRLIRKTEKNVEDEKAIKLIQAGLLPRYRELAMSRFQSLDDFLKSVDDRSDFDKKHFALRSTNRFVKKEVNEVKSFAEVTKQTTFNKSKVPAGNAVKSSNATVRLESHSGQTRSYKDYKCYNCNKMGHIANHCKLPRPKRYNSSSSDNGSVKSNNSKSHDVRKFTKAHQANTSRKEPTLADVMEQFKQMKQEIAEMRKSIPPTSQPKNE
ncbi:hypothetical protein B4U80_13277 [Leptotrombidium deliense]|uniref:CCHC-type domain-containing protein n=1 Tax=Leptotrombidium deliense TaxID=299467 RepID=A0A443S931_9ACAR|nr:hypothetical protein B4U80_13277 [Leptotrombidium deliense]